MTIVEDRGGEAEPVSAPPFAWKHFFAIVIGTILIITVVCTIATLVGKQEASFSFNDRPAETAPAQERVLA